MSKQRGFKLKKWEDADETLARLGQLHRELARCQGAFEEKCAVLAREFAAALKPLRNQQAHLVASLESFTREHANEMRGRSRRLRWGQVSLRRASRLMIPHEPDLVRRLQAPGYSQYLRFPPPHLNKEALCQLRDEELVRLGLARLTTEHFSYEIFPMESFRSPRYAGHPQQGILHVLAHKADRPSRWRGWQRPASLAQVCTA